MASSTMTTKGQIVIPKVIRDKYKLKPGVKVVFEETPEGLMIKTMTKDFIKAAKGMIPKTKGEKPMSAWWAEYKSSEMELEELSQVAEPNVPYEKVKKIKRTK